MSEKLARIAESDDVMLDEIIRVPSGHGTLPSICPQCKSRLDFGKIGGPELVCSNHCGWTYDR